MGGYLWTLEQDKFLIENYSKTDKKELANILGRSFGSLAHRASKLNLEKDRDIRYKSISNDFDVSHFLNLQTPEVCYILGMWWGDGHVVKHNAKRRRNVIRLKIDYNDFIDISQLFHKNLKGNLREEISKTGRRIAIFDLSHKILHDFLVEYDYLKKSILSADKILSIIPNHFKHYWLRGLSDADGTISNKNGYVISGSYLQDWAFIETILNNLGFLYNIRRMVDDKGDEKSHKRSYIQIRGLKNSLSYYDYIYSGKQFGLSRKFSIYQQLKNRKILYRSII